MSAAPCDRRAFLAICSAAGVGSTLFPGVLWGMVHPASEQQPSTPAPALAASEEKKPKKVTREMIDGAAAIAGITVADEYKDMMLRDLNDQVSSYEAIRKLELKNSEQLALSFDPLLPGMKVATAKAPM